MAEVVLEERSGWSNEINIGSENWSSKPSALCWWLNISSGRSDSWVIFDWWWLTSSSSLVISALEDVFNIGISVLWSAEVFVLWNQFNHSGESAGCRWASSIVTLSIARSPHGSSLWSINIDWMAEWCREELLWSVLLKVIPRASWDSVATMFFFAGYNVAWVSTSWLSRWIL